MKWAPKTIKSILQEYPNQISTSLLTKHSGLALAFDAVLHSFQGSNSILKQSQCISSDTSRYISVLCLRSKYAGEIAGLLSVLEDDKKKGLIDKLVSDVWDACQKKSDIEHRGALWRATAYLILCSGLNRKLLHAIASSQVELFTEVAMETSIECWQWILTARPVSLQNCFLKKYNA